MPVKGIERVKRNYRIAVKEIAEGKSERAVWEILSQGGAMAAQMTPMDTSTLVNSQYTPQVDIRAGKVKGHLGYTSEYAKWVHDAPGTLKGQPRADFGKTSNRSEVGPMRPRAFGGGTGVGNYWDPNAEPGFLTKGFDEIIPAISAILRKNYRV